MCQSTRTEPASMFASLYTPSPPFALSVNGETVLGANMDYSQYSCSVKSPATLPVTQLRAVTSAPTGYSSSPPVTRKCESYCLSLHSEGTISICWGIDNDFSVNIASLSDIILIILEALTPIKKSLKIL